MRANRLPLVVAALSLACRSGTSSVATQAGAAALTPSFPKPDLSTPDRALKSYWAVVDSLDSYSTRASGAERGSVVARSIDTAFAGVLAGDAREERLGHATSVAASFSREIVELKLDTDTRATAIVRVRNQTPVPPSVVISDSDAKERRDGSDVKYILEKGAAGWMVVQAYTQYSFLGGEWHPYFNPKRVPTYDFIYVTP